MEPTDKDRVRQNLKNYESNKKIHSLSNAALAGSLGLTGVGMWRKNAPLRAAGLTAAFASGFAHGKSKQKERHALNQIKRYYDLREKKASVAGLPQGSLIYGPAVMAASIAYNLSASHLGLPHGDLAQVASHLAPTIAAAGGDYLSIGRIKDTAQKGLSTITAATIKRGLGKPLNEVESKAFFEGRRASVRAKLFDKKPDGVLKKILRHFDIARNASSAAGHDFGNNVMPIFEVINKIDPKLTDDLIHAAATNDMGKLKSIYNSTKNEYKPAATIVAKELKEAITNFPGLQKELGGHVKTVGDFIGKTVASKGGNIADVAKRVNISSKNISDAAKNINTAIENIPGALVAKRLLGKGSGQILSETVSSNAGNIKNLSEMILEKSKRVKPTLMAIGAAGALGLIGNAVGKYREKHPLAKDSVVQKLLTYSPPNATQS